MQKAYDELFDENVEHFRNYIEDKIQFYFNDIQTQIYKFNTPVSETEKKKYGHALQITEELQEKLRWFDSDLNSSNVKL